MKRKSHEFLSLISCALLAVSLAVVPAIAQGGGSNNGSGTENSGGQQPGNQEPGGDQSGGQQQGANNSDSFEGWHGISVERNLVLPQVAIGGDITTTIVLANLGSRLRLGWLASDQLITSGTLSFFASSGDPMEVTIGGSTASEHSFSLDPSGVQFLEVTAEGSVETGWVLIQVDDPTAANADSTAEADWGYMDDQPVDRGKRLLATAYYTISDATGAVQSQVAVVPAVMEPARFFNAFLPVQYAEGIDTGIAIVNTGASDAQVSLVLRDTNGTSVAEEELTLGAGSQTARYVTQLFNTSALPEAFKGILEVTTEADGLVTLGLLQTGRVLTSLPVYHFGRWQQQD